MIIDALLIFCYVFVFFGEYADTSVIGAEVKITAHLQLAAK
ncbi:hypothetical protein [Pseudoxanthomonas kaohsiungensis]|nr:hypothetical protein [Pseudoxanthomonas kaohsiungensis]